MIVMKDENEGSKKLNAEDAALVIKLYGEHHEAVMRYIKEMLWDGCNMTAENILHETFYEAVRNKGDLVFHTNPAEWFIKVARYKLWAYFRRAGFHQFSCEDRIKVIAQLEDLYGIHK